MPWQTGQTILMGSRHFCCPKNMSHNCSLRHKFYRRLAVLSAIIVFTVSTGCSRAGRQKTGSAASASNVTATANARLTSSRNRIDISAVLHFTGKDAELVANDRHSSNPHLAHFIFPMIPADYQTQIVDIGLTYSMAVGSGECSQKEFMNALLARALVGFTFYAARQSTQYAKSGGVAAGFYEEYGKTTTDLHGNTTQVLIVHRILLTMISKEELHNVVPDFARGGVISNGSVMSDPECAQGETGDFPAYPKEWGGFLGYSKAELAPFLKVFRGNGGQLYWNTDGFVLVSFG